MTQDLRAGWTILPLRPGAAGKSWIAAPLALGGERLVFSGWIGHGEVRLLGGGDILASQSADPGFLFEISSRSRVFHLEHWLDGALQQLWEITETRTEETAPADPVPQARPPGPFALRGRMGQLFLGGDYNDSIGQFTEERSLSSASVAGWRYAFSQMGAWKKIFGLAHLDLLAAPAKEEVFRDHFPYPRARQTVTDDFLAQFAQETVIWPKWELHARRDLAYSVTDTHWTDYGATTAALAVLRRWSMSPNGLPETFKIRQRIGDLGSKMDPTVASFEICFLPEVSKRLVFDNGIVNNGNIRLYRNPQAPQPSGLMIFGDSFGTNLAEAFSGVFSEVTYAYQPAGLDPKLVEIMRPRHVLLQSTQRFLHGEPATGMSVFAKARAKLAELPPEKRDATLARLATVAQEFRRLADPLLGSARE